MAEECGCWLEHEETGVQPAEPLVIVYCPMHAAAKDTLAALGDMLALVDSGVLVRDTSRDHESGWAFKQVPIVSVLQAAQNALAKARGGAA